MGAARVAATDHRPLVTVVGLGPGDVDLVTAGTLAAIEAAAVRLVRTRRHPAARVLGEAPSCDDIYESATSMAEVYPAIVDRVVDLASTHGDALYAVPGSPSVAEHTVELLLADPRVEVRIVPALSFMDLTWTRLRIDPLADGVRLVDGHRFAEDAAGDAGPFLVCQCDRREVLSEIKLSVEEGPIEPVVVLQRLGLPDESIIEVDWWDLDRSFEPDHLTSLYVPRLDGGVAAEILRFEALVRRLREADAWKRAQTHRSLTSYAIEEAYEVVEAIEAFDPETGEGAEHLEEELGDLLYQVVLHSVIGAEEGWFSLADVARGIHDKLVERHPHVFEGRDLPIEQLMEDWEVRKAASKGRSGVMDGLPPGPALVRADRIWKRADSVGPVVGTPAEALGALIERVEELKVQPGTTGTAGTVDAEVLGDLLFALVRVARASGIDAEAALRAAGDRFITPR